MEHYENARNPVLPLQCHIPDGEAHVMSDGRLYVYGSYDGLQDRFCSDRYCVASTADMKNWQLSEVSFHGSQVPWVHDPNAVKYPDTYAQNPTPFLKNIAWPMFGKQYMNLFWKKLREGKQPKQSVDPRELLFAPDCIEKDGKYYLYFCMADNSEGVAVSDSPNGPFRDPVQLPVGGIDPAIFIDDDGTAYYYWGQFSSHGVKLNGDMVSFDPKDIADNLVTEEQHFFHEGSCMRKIGDTYYYVYADMERGKPTALGYATSKSPLGPFTYRGIIIDNALCDPQSWNNHGSIECFQGQWYVFYHRCSRGTHLYRRLCIEPITVLPDGTIPEVKMTSQGAGKPFGPGEIIMGYQACELHGKLYTGTDESYGEKLCHIRPGDEAVFRYVTNENDFTGIEITAAGSGMIDIFMDDKLAGTLEIQKGKACVSALQAPAGTHELRLRFSRSHKLEIYSLSLK